MSKKRRTKKQKLKARSRHLTASNSLKLENNQEKKLKTKAEVVKQESQEKIKEKKSSIEDVALFRYDKKLIYRDLLKSGLITLFIFGLLFGIYFWLK